MAASGETSGILDKSIQRNVLQLTNVTKVATVGQMRRRQGTYPSQGARVMAVTPIM